MDNYLSKPFSKQQLQAVLARWIPIKHTEPNDCNAHNSENTVVNSNPVKLENLRPLTTPSTNDRLPTIKILLIDDDPNFRLIASETLRAAAFFVEVATNGIQALEKIKQQSPDIVILDSVMEGINGFQTCRLLRTDPGMADVPIIMSTERGDSDSINKAFDAGATDLSFSLKESGVSFKINKRSIESMILRLPAVGTLPVPSSSLIADPPDLEGEATVLTWKVSALRLSTSCFLAAMVLELAGLRW